MGEKRFVAEQLIAPDEIDPRKLRPFGRGEFIDNMDGTRSTEKTMSFNIEGREVLLPSIWMTDRGPVDLSRNPEAIVRAMIEFEKRTGKKFPRFSSVGDVEAFAKRRSNSGAVQSGPLAK